MPLTRKETLLLGIIDSMRAAVQGMKYQHDQYQDIFFELFELSKIVRDGYAIGFTGNKNEVLDHVDSELTKLSQLLADFI